jgi:hypothetical protein
VSSQGGGPKDLVLYDQILIRRGNLLQKHCRVQMAQSLVDFQGPLRGSLGRTPVAKSGIKDRNRVSEEGVSQRYAAIPLTGGRM